MVGKQAPPLPEFAKTLPVCVIWGAGDPFIHVEFAEDLIDIAMDEATGIGARIQYMRNHIAGAYGIVIPEIV